MKIIYNSPSPKDLEVGNTYEVKVSGWGMIRGGIVEILGMVGEYASYKYLDNNSIARCHGIRDRQIREILLSLGR